MTPEVEAFLEHSGVKGMKWGVRKASNTANKIRKSRVKSRQDHLDRLSRVNQGTATKEDKRLITERRVRNARNVTRAVVLVGVGATFVGAAMQAKGGKKLPSIPKDPRARELLADLRYSLDLPYKHLLAK